MIVSWIGELLNIPLKEAETIYAKARAGGEFDNIDETIWFEERFAPNIVWIDEGGYAHMAIDALKILGETAATDYGSSRQRDLGQLWGDMTRGYLAEYAFKLYAKNRWRVGIELGHESGSMDTFLGTDIHQVYKSDEGEFRTPAINVSIKGTKWNGIWLDIPGAQFHHSHVHILVKVGVSRDHLFAYLKHISVFRDKVLKKGVEAGTLSSSDADMIFSLLPDFKPVPAYISGFVPRDIDYYSLPYAGKRGKKHFTVTSWNGAIEPGDLDRIKLDEGLPQDGQVKFEGIGKFAHDKGYLFNIGKLWWQDEDWQSWVIDRL